MLQTYLIIGLIHVLVMNLVEYTIFRTEVLEVMKDEIASHGKFWIVGQYSIGIIIGIVFWPIIIIWNIVYFISDNC